MNLTLVLLAAMAGPAADAPRPHIVFVLADDLGPGDIGCCGGEIVPTPNLDRLASEGTRFTRYYAAAPICSPSRCGLLTGQFPGRWKITSYLQTKTGNVACRQVDYLDPNAPSIARALKKAGYKTAHIGKWHLGGGRDVKDAPKFAAYGFDEHAGTWESPEPHPDITSSNWIWSSKDKVKRWERTGFFIDKTLDFLGRHKSSPCFVNLWLDDPHTPWVIDAKAGGKPPSTVKNLRGVMTEVDRQVGRLLDGLKKLGLDDKTLVIFTSDNGPLPTLGGARSGGLRGSKLSLYEGGICVPFLARWPGKIPAGSVDSTTVLAAVDLYPTFCKLAGAAHPEGTKPDGEDRSDALFGKPASTRSRPLFWEYGRNNTAFVYPREFTDRSPNVAVLDGDWKLLVDAGGGGAQLYDVSADPKEERDQMADKPDVVARLKKSALDWRKSLPQLADR